LGRGCRQSPGGFRRLRRLVPNRRARPAVGDGTGRPPGATLLLCQSGLARRAAGPALRPNPGAGHGGPRRGRAVPDFLGLRGGSLVPVAVMIAYRRLGPVLLCACLGLSGCAFSERLRQAAGSFRHADEAVTRAHGRFSPADAQARRAAQDIDRPWLAGRAQPLARELTLPAPLRAHVRTTLLFADGTDDLRRIGRRIAAVTGIPVHVRPDALLPARLFLPRL